MSISANQIRSLLPEISEIKDKELQDNVVLIWKEACENGGINQPEIIPKNITNIGYTLVNHTRVVASLCKRVAELIKSLHGIEVNQDYLLAGALLHDVSKLLEMTYNGRDFVKTDFGKKIQHGFYTAYKAYEKRLPLEIQHMLISHTPESRVMLQSIEAVILYNVDQTDTEILNQSLGLPLTPKH